MTWVEIVILAALLAELAGALLVIRDLRSASTALAVAAAHAEARTRDQAERITALDELRSNRELASQLLGSGSHIARSLQRSLGELPTPLLANLPQTARVARELHQSLARDIDGVLTLLGKKRGTSPAGHDGDPPPAQKD